MRQDSNHIAIADVMAALALIFLFISVNFMLDIEERNKKIESVAKTYNEVKLALNQALKKEFAKDLKKWNAEILDNNTFRFKSPDMLFQTGESAINIRFQEILNDFFPRYIAILRDKRFRNDIDEIRIEGHTSSVWGNAHDLRDRYINNAKLSQDRAFQVLDYCTSLDEVQKNLQWLIKLFRANGLSFAKPIIVNSQEDSELSRRVEFRVITKTEEKIYKILNLTKEE